mgnify:FL=1
MVGTRNPFLNTLLYETSRIMMNSNKPVRPTEGELEILGVLWNKGAATVRDVHEEINKTRESGYTTTLKLMQIMYDKGLVHRDASAKTHVYKAAVTQSATQEMFLHKMINNLYAGSSAQLVMHALGNNEASEEELEQIRQFIQQLKEKK